MLFKNLESDADYFLVDENFARVSYEGTYLTYSFEIYGKILQALLDGFDTVNVSIMASAKNLNIKYFQGKSKELIDVSNLDFVQYTKRELKKLIDDETIATRSFELEGYVSDTTLSEIGSGKITDQNYAEHLPRVESVSINTEQLSARSFFYSDDQKPNELGIKLFENYGIFPGIVGEISFPIKKESSDSDGTAYSISNNSKKLLANSDVNDYYERFFKTVSPVRQTKIVENKKAEYQRFSTEIVCDTPTFDDARAYAGYSTLYLRLGLSKDGVETSSVLFPFDNKRIFSRATAGAKNVAAKIITTDPKYVLPDVIEIENRENFPIEASVFGVTLSEKRYFEKDQLSTVRLGPKQSLTVESEKIFFSENESRAYTVTANKFIPGVDGVSNVLSILSPPQSAAPSRQPGKIEINITPGNQREVTVNIFGMKTNDYSARIFRYRLGDTEKKYIANVNFSSPKFSDRDIVIGEIYIYEAHIDLNSAANFAKVSTGYIAYDGSEITRINFNIADQNQRSTRQSIRHSFKIIESVTTTTPTKLLGTLNQSGQAGRYEDELEAVKQSTTMVTSYSVYRNNQTTGEFEYLGDADAGKKLQYSVSRDKSVGSQYTYYVLPKASETGAVSYKTVVEANDTGTGKTYKYIYKKWRDKNYVRAETLPSFGDIVKDDIAAALANLPEGSARTVSFSRSRARGTVVGLTAESLKSPACTFISWRYTGSTEEVLHFVVVATYNGVTAPVGISMPDKSKDRNGVYSYCDDVLGFAGGSVLYKIVPVMIDGTIADESAAAEVKSSDNYPKKALTNV